MEQHASSSGVDSSPRKTLLASVLVVFVVVLAAGLVATPVTAHAYLSESDPANGEQIDDVPDEITLSFSGDGIVNADVAIENPDGEIVSSEPEIVPEDSQIVRVPIEASEDDADLEGMYTVDWEVLADDGHTTSGSFFFAVGDEPLDRDAVLEAYEEGDDGEEDESMSPLEAGAKSLLLVGVAGLIGIPAIAAVAVGPVFARAAPQRRDRADDRLGPLLAGAALLTSVGALGLGLARSTALGPLSVGTIVEFGGTPLGRAWLLQVVLAVGVAALVAGLVCGYLSRRESLAGTCLGALAVAGTIAWTSHSATAIDRLTGAVVDFVHVVGAGLWVGGLAVLAFVVVPTVREAAPADRPGLLAAVIRRFSVLALVGVTFVVTTGFVLASWHVPTASGLTETVYGLVLVVKLLVVAVALALGGLTRVVLLGRLESTTATESTAGSRPTSADGGRNEGEPWVSRIARSVRLEVTLLVVVLLLSGILTSAPTAAVAGVGADGDEPIEATIEYEYDDVLVELTVLPAVADSTDDSFELRSDEPTVFEIGFLENETPIESEQPVRLLASDREGTEIELELEETDDGTYATVQPLPDAGDWELRITGAPDGTYISEWIETTVVSAQADSTHEHDHGGREESHGSSGHDHDREPADTSSPFRTLLEFAAVVTAIAGSLAVVVDALQIRSRSD
ncbi:copper resistance CopC/CopD family protein [Halobiforma nitratireducens]|uniref:Copper resistance protein CopC n=1 Tax=Halobiforma nitratireducens JCM 10879 TaxID=1227454 RepID=M0LSA4_9EURY|nr:copper resistance protein CopC [Halobiforma nitratireducens]EMA35314.1 copper resistance protein CopC [Halobiforma nitratireducens JCM 10879]